MGAWGTSVFSDDLAMDVRREYGILLSVGKDNNEVEEMLINYYSSILNCNDPEEEVFWLALALSEWKKGRLSSMVKAKALSALENGRDLERWRTAPRKKDYEKRKKALKEAKEIILSPLPPVKKIKKPTVHHCPWKEGSLLAYRIVSNKESLIDHPCFEKYVLLRIVKIHKHPISNLFNTGYYNEMMLVGLYNWIGSEIPNPKIVQKLKYITIEDFIPQKPAKDIDWSYLEKLPEEAKESVRKTITTFFEGKIVRYEWLDWRSAKNEEGDITYLDCDENFQNDIPDDFKPIQSDTLTHFLPFDVTLAKRFESYVGNDPNSEYVLI